MTKHNLRKYKSSEYRSENVELIFGTKDLYQDVQNVYHEEFDEIVQEYNKKQTRADRRIDNYFEHDIKEEFGEKKKGRNHDLSVVEYKVAKETEHLSEVQEQAKDADIDVFASKLAGKEIIRIAKDNEKRVKEKWLQYSVIIRMRAMITG